MPQKICLIRHFCIPARISPFHPVLCVKFFTKFVTETTSANMTSNRKNKVCKYIYDTCLCIEVQVVGGLVMLCYGGRCCSRCSATFIVLSFLFGLGRSLQAAKQGNFSRPFCLPKSVHTNLSPKPKLVRKISG